MKSLFTAIAILIISMLPITAVFGQNKIVVDSLLNELEGNLSKKNQIEVYLALATQFTRSDSLKMADYLSQAKKIAKEIDNKEITADVLFVEGRYLVMRGKRAEAKALFSKALEESKIIGYEKGEAFAIAQIAIVYLTTGYLDSAATLLSKAIDLQKMIDDKKGLAASYHSMGNYNSYKGDMKEARNYYLLELDLIKNLGGNRGYSSIYLNLGNTFAKQGIYVEALEYYFKASAWLEKTGGRRTLGMVSNSIGNVFLAQKDYARSLSYYEKALNIALSVDNPRSVALCYDAMGSVYAILQEEDKAIDYYNKSLAIREEIGDRRGIANNLQDLGDLYSSNEENNQAISLFERSIQLRRTIGDKKGLAGALMDLGKLYLKLKNASMASRYIKEGLSIAKEIDSMDEMRDGYGLVASLENVQGNYQKAYDAHVQYKELADSIINTEKTREITRMEADFEFQQERDSVAFAQEEIQLGYEKEIERRTVINQAAIGGGALVLVILILLYRSYLIKQKSNTELRHKNELIAYKNQELTSKNEEITGLRETEKKMAEESLALKERELTNVTMLSHEKNELLQQIGEQIGGLSNKVDERIIPDLKEIKQTIKSNISDETWHSFTYHFEQVHPEFFNKLKARYDDLSQNDLRLCAYIKVGLNNKVIAQMGNVTLAAVKKNINRLKKKMDIGPDDSLRDFMMEFV